MSFEGGWILFPNSPAPELLSLMLTPTIILGLNVTLNLTLTLNRYLSVNSPAPELFFLTLMLALTITLTLTLTPTLISTLTLSLTLTLPISLTLAVNSGAGELTDKNQLLKCVPASGPRVRVRVKIRRSDATHSLVPSLVISCIHILSRV